MICSRKNLKFQLQPFRFRGAAARSTESSRAKAAQWPKLSRRHDKRGRGRGLLLYNRAVLVSDFDFALPAELIAQERLADRAAARLLHLVRAAERFEDRGFSDLAELLRPGRPAGSKQYASAAGPADRTSLGRPRAASQSAKSSGREFLRGRVELLLTRQLSAEPQIWQALVHPGRKIGIGEVITIAHGGARLEAEVIARGGFGERTVRFAPVADFFQQLEALGHVPLPPYIDRPDRPEDREHYQTVYATRPGSVAAPTAGLHHFTPEMLARLGERGVESAEITLHVGLGTFQPVRTELVEEHRFTS